MKQFFFLLVALAVFQGTLTEEHSVSKQDNGFKCRSHLFGIHSDPERCDRFYICSHGEAKLHACPSNWLFNSFTRTCAISSLVSCGSRPKPGHGFKCKHYLPGIYADPERCDEYITCSMKKPTSHKCPMNMLFNTVTKTCAIPALVNCGDRVKPDHKTTTSPAPTTETPDEGFKCKNSFYGVYADPERCDRFYTCSMKKATSHKCPGNWLFNSLTRTCAIPALVSCGDRVIPGHETTTTPATSTTTTTLAPTTEIPDEGFKCKNSFYGVYADPKRCDRFYTCSMKKATLHKCPGNWLFNSLTRTCAIPALVSCGDRVIPGHETTTTPVTSTTTTTTTLAPTTETPDEGFKCKNSLYGVYADPKRCDRYYTCSMKKATLHKCPGNWLFNSLTRTCAIPALVSCGGRVIPTVPTSTTEIPTTTETTTIPTTVPTSTRTSPTTTETTTIPTTVPTSPRTSPTTTKTTTIPTTVPTSPRTSPTTTKTTTIPTTVPTRTTKIPTTVADCATDGYFPVVGDCSRFFICHNGMRYDQRCVDGLVYNPIMEICDWPANVPSCK